MRQDVYADFRKPKLGKWCMISFIIFYTQCITQHKMINPYCLYQSSTATYVQCQPQCYAVHIATAGHGNKGAAFKLFMNKTFEDAWSDTINYCMSSGYTSGMVVNIQMSYNHAYAYSIIAATIMW